MMGVKTDRTVPGIERLSARELQVLEHRADGEGPRETAARLGITYPTLRTHQQRILTKLGAHSILEAVTTAMRAGVIR